MNEEPLVRPTIVIDTSVAAKWFLPEPGSYLADAILEALRQGAIGLAAPDLIVYEFAKLLWQRQRRGQINRSQASAIHVDFERLPLKQVAADALAAAALQIAIDTGCTAYDSAFVALAAGLESYVITADDKLMALLKDTKFSSQVRSLAAFAP